MNKASFGKRFVAALIDGIILGVAQSILGAILGMTAGRLFGIVIGVAYFAYFEGGATGQTLGKKVMNIRVVSTSGGQLPMGQAVIRYFGRIVSSIPLLLGYFWMLWDKNGQTWHDKFASSYVVNVG